MSNQKPKEFETTSQRLPEITVKAICLSILLALLLAASNAYLALKIGILTSASIPAAILSMGILRFFKYSNILENNLVQTAASAGEAVAGGIVYTIPALIILRFWTHFSYWENVAIAMIGGILGVLFSIPLRRVLVSEPSLRFPEGHAIAELLQLGSRQSMGFKEMLSGGLVGALLECTQTGFKVLANSSQAWFAAGKTLFGFGAGYSAAMIGAGYLVGIRTGVSLFIGALIGWLASVPLVSTYLSVPFDGQDATQAVMTLWENNIRYIGIGAMLLAGVWTLCLLLRPFLLSLVTSYRSLRLQRQAGEAIPRTEFDIPMRWVLSGILALGVLLFYLLNHLIDVSVLGFTNTQTSLFFLCCVFYILLMGFLVAAICGYFSGMVGVTATPGSAILIVAFLLAGVMLHLLLKSTHSVVGETELYMAAIVTIILGSVITGAAAIANDNIQDLKVGHLIGATPWKQQVMLMLGVIVASLIIPPVMEVLFNVYGIGGVYPHPGMDPTQVLAAPPAAMFAAITQAVFHQGLPWRMIVIGSLIAVLFISINPLLHRRGYGLSVLAIATGIYLPLSSSIPIFIGSVFAALSQRALDKRRNSMTADQVGINRQRGLLLACGLVSGAALMDVLLAVPFAIKGSPNALQLWPSQPHYLSSVLSILSIFILAKWFLVTVTHRK